MSGAGAKLSIGLDAKDFQKGINNGVIEPLENAEETLKDLAKNKSLDQLTDEFKDVQKETEETADKADELNKAIRDLGKRGKSAGGEMRDGMHEAGEGVSKFKEESVDTAREVAQSFDGSAESIVGMFQEIAAVSLGGFGPAGVAAGIGIAAGIGLATTAFQDAEAQAERVREKVAELANVLITKGELGFSDIADELLALATAADPADENLTKLRDTAKKAAVPFDIMAQAVAGNQDAIDALLPTLKDQKQAQDDIVAAQAEWNETASTASSQANYYQEAISKLEESQLKLTGAQEAATLAQQAQYDRMVANASIVDTVNAAYDQAAGSVMEYVDAETGMLDIEAYLNAVQARSDALKEYQENLTRAQLTPDQVSALDSLGIDAASAIMAGWESYSPEQKARTKAMLEETAKASSGAAVKVFDEAIPKQIKTDIKLNVNAGTVSSDLDRITRDRMTRVTVDWRDKYGKPVY